MLAIETLRGEMRLGVIENIVEPLMQPSREHVVLREAIVRRQRVVAEEIRGPCRVQQHHSPRNRRFSGNPVLAGVVTEVDIDASLKQRVAHLRLRHVSDGLEFHLISQRSVASQEVSRELATFVWKKTDVVVAKSDRSVV